ncbi:protein Wnt-8a-like [Photinus pyralis]|nr:protein Wnt-8a-like [Photinus pyralis]
MALRIKEKATKEQAVVHAILSAGLVHAVTRNCSKGVLQSCGCNPKLRSSIPANPRYITSSGLVRSKNNLKQSKIQWSWGGCSDDVEYGQSLAKKVLDDLEVGFDSQTYANLHNNLVGRMIIRNTMIKKCRCHGVSGSCSLQTCWLQVAPFQKVAEVIRQRYKKAVKIMVENRATFEPSPTAPPRVHDLSNHQLAFIERSPDYCIPDSTIGWPGTKGRPCLRGRSKGNTLLERRSCKNLCRHCGHRVRKYKRQVKKNCNCSFIWCCEVKCDNCTEVVEEFFCD